MIMLNIVSWNCEDFFVYKQQKELILDDKNISYELQYSSIIDKLKEAHIILLQEWNNDNGNFINTYLPNYGILIVDRTAVLYKKNFFGKNVKYIEIPLLHEAPTPIERMYTSGRQKSNIFVKLYYDKLPIYVGCFHLNAYSPFQHPGFHRRQLNDYINKCINTELFQKSKYVKNKNNNEQGRFHCVKKKYAFIIGGDTNFNDGRDHSHLFEQLISEDIKKQLQLSDVCHDKCNTTMTQYPECMHEKDFGKIIARNISKLKNYSSRLDLLLVNQTILPISTNIINDCNISDHSLISSKTVLNIQSSCSAKNIRRSSTSNGRRRSNRRKY